MTEVNWLHYQVVYSDRVKLLTKFQRECWCNYAGWWMTRLRK